MQFIGAKGFALCVAVLTGSCAVGLGLGLIVGRNYPAHVFQKYGETRFLLESTTGKLCAPFRDPSANPADLSDLFPPKDASSGQIAAKSPTDQTLSNIWKSPYPPACVK